MIFSCEQIFSNSQSSDDEPWVTEVTLEILMAYSHVFLGDNVRQHGISRNHLSRTDRPGQRRIQGGGRQRHLPRPDFQNAKKKMGKELRTEGNISKKK